MKIDTHTKLSKGIKALGSSDDLSLVVVRSQDLAPRWQQRAQPLLPRLGQRPRVPLVVAVVVATLPLIPDTLRGSLCFRLGRLCGFGCWCLGVLESTTTTSALGGTCWLLALTREAV